MWPATTSSTGFSLLACIWNSLPMRSFLPLVALRICAPDSRRPEYTRMKVSVPKKGCVAILKARAENGASFDASRSSTCSSSFTAWPLTAPASSGFGR